MHYIRPLVCYILISVMAPLTFHTSAVGNQFHLGEEAGDSGQRRHFHRWRDGGDSQDLTARSTIHRQRRGEPATSSSHNLLDSSYEVVEALVYVVGSMTLYFIGFCSLINYFQSNE